MTERRIFTVADVDRDGYDQVLAELRGQFQDAHAPYPQYRGWTDGTVLAEVTARQGGVGTFVRAEAGDVVLMKPDRHLRPFLTPDHTFYVPRVGWNCGWSYGYRRLDSEGG